MTGTRNVPDGMKGKEISAFNIVFLLKLGHHTIEVPADYCGTSRMTYVRKRIKHGKSVTRHFNHDDKVCPKNYKNKEIIFLGPKPKPGGVITFPELFSEARKFVTGEKYQVAGVRLRHALSNR